MTSKMPPAAKELGVRDTLTEALLAGFRNWKLILLITLLLPFPCDCLSHIYTLKVSFTMNSKKLKSQVSIQIAKIFASPITTAVFVYLSLTACSSPSRFKLRKLLSKLGRTWRGFALTFLCSMAASFIFHSVLRLSVIALQMISDTDSWWMLLASLVLALLLFCGLYVAFYLSIVADMSLVISVAEEGCYGLGAIGRAAGMVRRRKLRGFVLTVLTALLRKSTSMFFDIVKDDSMDAVWTLGFIVVGNVEKLYDHLVRVVYYHECKKSHERGRDGGENGLYSPEPLHSSNL